MKCTDILLMRARRNSKLIYSTEAANGTAYTDTDVTQEVPLLLLCHCLCVFRRSGG